MRLSLSFHANDPTFHAISVDLAGQTRPKAPKAGESPPGAPMHVARLLAVNLFERRLEACVSPF